MRLLWHVSSLSATIACRPVLALPRVRACFSHTRFFATLDVEPPLAPVDGRHVVVKGLVRATRCVRLAGCAACPAAAVHRASLPLCACGTDRGCGSTLTLRQSW